MADCGILLLEVTRYHWRLLQITGDYWRLLEITRGALLYAPHAILQQVSIHVLVSIVSSMLGLGSAA